MPQALLFTYILLMAYKSQLDHHYEFDFFQGLLILFQKYRLCFFKIYFREYMLNVGLLYHLKHWTITIYF
jgi:hypothetical protein